ncbi:MAG: hypothetical protein HQL82_02165 [Magnetococcales bacterium]|nr:hypothetical protein [Magnetococcales bacterium]
MPPPPILGLRCVLLLMAVLGLFPWTARADATLTLIYSGGLRGHLEPCGCDPETDFGGLHRQGVWLERLRRDHPQAVVISGGDLLSATGPADRLKGEFILRGLALLGYDGVALQWSDLVYGRNFLATAPLPWATGTLELPPLARQVGIRRGNREILLLNHLDPQAAPDRGPAGAWPGLETGTSALAAAIAASRQRNALVILASSLPEKRALAELPLADVDLLLLTASEQGLPPRQVERTLILVPQERGMSLGLLELTLDAAGRIAAWQHQQAALGPDLGRSPALEPWYEAYTQRVKAAAAERIHRLRARRESGDSRPFLGAAQCRSCHEEQHARWLATAHGTALASLERVGKGFDSDCLPCHTVGFNAEGGFVEQGLTPHLANVQCESCHGPGAAHGASKGKVPPGRIGDQAGLEACRDCHNALHSPGFDWNEYRTTGVPCGTAAPGRQ